LYKARAQINTIDGITKPTKKAGQRYQMQLVKARLAAARDHLLMSAGSPGINDTRQLPGIFP
jgi:hypothetical protein